MYFLLYIEVKAKSFPIRYEKPFEISKAYYVVLLHLDHLPSSNESFETLEIVGKVYLLYKSKTTKRFRYPVKVLSINSEYKGW